MDGRPTWTDCDEAGDYVVPNVLNPRDLVFRPDNMDETVPQTVILNTIIDNSSHPSIPAKKRFECSSRQCCSHFLFFMYM